MSFLDCSENLFDSGSGTPRPFKLGLGAEMLILIMIGIPPRLWRVYIEGLVSAFIRIHSHAHSPMFNVPHELPLLRSMKLGLGRYLKIVCNAASAFQDREP